MRRGVADWRYRGFSLVKSRMSNKLASECRRYGIFDAHAGGNAETAGLQLFSLSAPDRT